MITEIIAEPAVKAAKNKSLTFLGSIIRNKRMSR